MPNRQEALTQLINATEQYQRAVKGLFEIDPTTKKCFAEGSPTKDQETYERFIAFNNTGVALSNALRKARDTA
jgi:hypothetical protein